MVDTIDDGQNKNGDQNITVNVAAPGIGSKALKYAHISQVTNGWKWVTIGDVDLAAGENTVAFVKDASTYVAFSMSQFKLVPKN